MSTECSICLEPYRDASSIPCGHIFCFPCLQGHIFKTSKDGLNAACRTCKLDFTFVTPDATLVMEPLRKHMHATIRKVFVDINTNEFDDLKAAYKKQADELKDAEKRVKELEKKLKSAEMKLKASEPKAAEDKVRIQEAECVIMNIPDFGQAGLTSARLPSKLAAQPTNIEEMHGFRAHVCMGFATLYLRNPPQTRTESDEWPAIVAHLCLAQLSER
ncbi:hypothetical protein BDZ89DRAFT_1149433 [Hymenopellis radicata]|nr:hypothetical protein BDZ89DRAFT_1149433 [Hymenopellis radicata]